MFCTAANSLRKYAVGKDILFFPVFDAGISATSAFFWDFFNMVVPQKLDWAVFSVILVYCWRCAVCLSRTEYFSDLLPKYHPSALLPLWYYHEMFRPYTAFHFAYRAVCHPARRAGFSFLFRRKSWSSLRSWWRFTIVLFVRSSPACGRDLRSAWGSGQWITVKHPVSVWKRSALLFLIFFSSLKPPIPVFNQDIIYLYL